MNKQKIIETLSKGPKSPAFFMTMEDFDQYRELYFDALHSYAMLSDQDKKDIDRNLSFDVFACVNGRRQKE